MTVITIYVRHSIDCKYAGDEFTKRCKCRKHLRWTKDGKQYRRTAGTRSWEEAESVKREIEDQLSGKADLPKSKAAKDIRAAIDVFIADKRVENLSADLIKKYERELARLAKYSEDKGAFTLARIDREIITGLCKDWNALYPSSLTRNKLAERYKSFLKFCSVAGWLAEVPQWPKMKADETPTLPLTEAEYGQLLNAVYVVVRAPQDAVVENQGYEYWCNGCGDCSSSFGIAASLFKTPSHFPALLLSQARQDTGL